MYIFYIYTWICDDMMEMIRIQSWFAIKWEMDAIMKWTVIQIQNYFINFKVLKPLL